MVKQRIVPVHISREGETEVLSGSASDFPESVLRDLIHAHPEILPIGQIDPSFTGAISVCTELRTPAGRIDNFLVTSQGFPVIVECKLWRNPQARREVIGQALDYAKELSRWTSADIEREAAQRGVASLAELVRAKCDDFDEPAFYDTLTRCLAKGRCLLLIVGDGIQESVEAIFEHLRQQGALHFSFGLVECPIFELPQGDKIAVPRVVARSVAEIRQVVALPDGYVFSADEVDTSDNPSSGNEVDESQQRYREYWLSYWQEFNEVLDLDDPEQPPPKPARRAHVALSMPGPKYASWLVVYRLKGGEAGVFLSSSKGGIGEKVAQRLVDERGPEILRDLGTGSVITVHNTGQTFSSTKFFREGEREESMLWLAEVTNRFVNVLRPLIRSAMADLEESGGAVD